jgi:hypothetical protein
MKAELEQINYALAVELVWLSSLNRYQTDNKSQRVRSLRTAIATIDKLLAQPEQPMSIPIIEFRSKVSGLWYRNPQAAGTVDAVRRYTGAELPEFYGLPQDEPEQSDVAKLVEAGDAMRDGHWADVAARKVASHFADFGYLAPAPKVDAEAIIRIFENGSGTWNSVAAKKWCREQLTKLLNQP